MSRKELKSMKLDKLIVLMLSMAVFFTACSQSSHETAPGSIMEETVASTVSTQPLDSVNNIQQADPMQERLEKRCEEIASLYYDSIEVPEDDYNITIK